MISYSTPRKRSTFSVPETPSITISMLPIRITQKPQKTRACSSPITGLRKILVCPKATFSMSMVRCPICLTGKAGLVSLKNLINLRVVHPKAAMVISRAIMKTTCFTMVGIIGLWLFLFR